MLEISFSAACTTFSPASYGIATVDTPLYDSVTDPAHGVVHVQSSNCCSSTHPVTSGSIPHRHFLSEQSNPSQSGSQMQPVSMSASQFVYSTAEK